MGGAGQAERGGASHLHGVRLFGVFVVRDAEAQGVLGALDQHEGGALKPRAHNTPSQ